MGRETTPEREHVREIDCTSVLGNQHEFPFISQSVRTSAADLSTVWNQEKFMTLFLLPKNIQFGQRDKAHGMSLGLFNIYHVLP